MHGPIIVDNMVASVNLIISQNSRYKYHCSNWKIVPGFKCVVIHVWEWIKSIWKYTMTIEPPGKQPGSMWVLLMWVLSSVITENSTSFCNLRKKKKPNTSSYCRKVNLLTFNHSLSITSLVFLFIQYVWNKIVKYQLRRAEAMCK